MRLAGPFCQNDRCVWMVPCIRRRSFYQSVPNMPQLTISHLFYRMLLMKLGILAALLFWVGLLTGWGDEWIEDPDLRPPVVDQKAMEKRGRIVLNLHPDGSVTGRDLQDLETDESIKDYITTCKEQVVAEGKEPSLHIRGEAETVFKECRRVIKIGHDLGVTHVFFAVYQKPELENEASGPKTDNDGEVIELPDNEARGLINRLIKPREQDLDMKLPAVEAGKAVAKEVFIHLDAQGQVFIGMEKKPLDRDADNREMPLLKAELEKLKAADGKLGVRIHVDRETIQQRVIDLLNTLAAVDISMVTFVDAIEP